MFPFETGGVLVGYLAQNDVVVSKVVGPGPDAVHDLCKFIPDYSFHENQIAKLYSESGRRYIYLGDWHTHPRQQFPEMSQKDISTLKRIARHKPARITSPIMLIMSGDPNAWSLVTWRYQASPILSLRPGITRMCLQYY